MCTAGSSRRCWDCSMSRPARPGRPPWPELALATPRPLFGWRGRCVRSCGCCPACPERTGGPNCGQARSARCSTRRDGWPSWSWSTAPSTSRTTRSSPSTPPRRDATVRLSRCWTSLTRCCVSAEPTPSLSSAPSGRSTTCATSCPRPNRCSWSTSCAVDPSRATRGPRSRRLWSGSPAGRWHSSSLLTGTLPTTLSPPGARWPRWRRARRCGWHCGHWPARSPRWPHRRASVAAYGETAGPPADRSDGNRPEPRRSVCSATGRRPMGERLSMLDASFLYFEEPDTPMHVSGVLILEKPPGGVEALAALVAARLSLVPRYRQRVAEVPGHLANPVWVDDPDFDLAYHVRRSGLPRPGTEEQLLDLVSRLSSRPLDRRRPLWEAYLVEGLSGDRVAVVTKTHPALVDGLSALDLGQVLLNGDPDSPTPPADEWRPRRLPSGAELVWEALDEYARR